MENEDIKKIIVIAIIVLALAILIKLLLPLLVIILVILGVIIIVKTLENGNIEKSAKEVIDFICKYFKDIFTFGKGSKKESDEEEKIIMELKNKLKKQLQNLKKKENSI